MIDFLVIGAQKCATSWLYNCLNDHPKIYLPPHKDQMDYIGGDQFKENGREWFEERKLNGADSSKLKGDISVEYLHDKRSPQCIVDYLSEVKIIVSLRNPIERAVSAYYWYQRKGFIDSNITLETALAKGMANLNNGLVQEYSTDIINRGLYYNQLSEYLKFLARENFFFIIFDHIKEDPLSVIQKVYSFIGVDKSFNPSSIKSQPKNNTYFNFLSNIESKFRSNRLVEAAIVRLNQYLGKLGIENKKQEISHQLRKDLTLFFYDDMSSLNKLLDSFPEEQITRREDLLNLWNFNEIEDY